MLTCNVWTLGAVCIWSAAGL